MKPTSLSTLLCGVLALGAQPLPADVVLEESYDLAAGWNLIQVPLEPIEKDAAKALAGVDWVSLWSWLPDIPFGNSADRGGRWLVLYQGEPAFLNNLVSFSGPASYAILARSAGTLRIRGTLRGSLRSLRGFAFHLFGPNVPSSSPPSVAAYFSRPGVLESIGDLYEHAGGAYRKVGSGEALRRGAAYWLRTAQDVPAPDPMRIVTGLGGLRFNPQTTLQDIELDLGVGAGGGAGGIAEPRRLDLRTIPSLDSTGAADWLDLQKPDGTFAPLAVDTAIEVDPLATRARITLRARQEGAVTPGAVQKALAVEVTGSTGSVLVGADLELVTLKGRWTGEAFLTEVERPSFHGGGFAPAASLPVSLILEVPAAGQPRLLPCLELNGNRDGRNIRYRMNAALFPDPVTLLGTVATDGKSGTLRGASILDPRHPLNPYRHHYHPEHAEGFAVDRKVTLRFGATLPGSPGPDSPLATVGVLSGVYEEEINGLSREPIRVRGSFQLRGVSSDQASPCSGTGQ
jgi:hypothetical protein